jgi:hypothetical protein
MLKLIRFTSPGRKKVWARFLVTFATYISPCLVGQRVWAPTFSRTKRVRSAPAGDEVVSSDEMQKKLLISESFENHLSGEN